MKKDLSQEEKMLKKYEKSLQGKNVIVVGNKIYSAVSGEEARKMLKKVRKLYPNKTPLVTYIPSADALILCL